MNKYLIVSICVLATIMLANTTWAQSVKGKVWQSQDSTFRYEPSTLVTNSDGSFNYIGYRFVNNELYSSNALFSEGKYNETKGSLNFSVYRSGYSVFEKSYLISWINSSEFILTEGVKKHHYVEMGTTADQFTPKYLIPYLQQKIENKEPVDECYVKLIEEIKTKRLAASQSQNSNVVTEPELSKKQINKDDEIGEFYSTVSGKVFTLKHSNYTVMYDFKEDMTYSLTVRQKLTDRMVDYEQNGSYSQNNDSIVFSPTKEVEIENFEGGGRIERPSTIKNGNNSYGQKIIWVNDYMFRMRFNNVKRLFVAM